MNALIAISLVWASISVIASESYPQVLEKCEPGMKQSLDTFFTNVDKEALVFEPLEGGFTRAKLYAFFLDEKKYVLRFMASGQPQKFWENEIKAQETAGLLGIAPACLFTPEGFEFMIMPFVEGHLLNQEDIQEEKITTLGKHLQALHSFKGDYPTKHTLSQRIQIQYQKAVASGIAYPTGFEKALEALAKEPSYPLVPSHGDLHRGNILVEGDHISFIDWTNASFDDPFTDLSYLSLLNNMTPLQEQTFLTAYFGRAPTEKDGERLKAGKAKVCLVIATIWFRFGESLEDKKIPLEQRVALLDEQLNSPLLKPASAYLRAGLVVNIHSENKQEVRLYALSFYKAYLESQSL